MDKLLVLLMIVLFAVGLTSITIFQSDGLQQDALTMKDSTLTIIKDANTQMDTFTGTETP